MTVKELRESIWNKYPPFNSKLHPEEGRYTVKMSKEQIKEIIEDIKKTGFMIPTQFKVMKFTTIQLPMVGKIELETVENGEVEIIKHDESNS